MPDHEAFFEDHLVPEDRRGNIGAVSLLAGWAIAVMIFGALLLI